MSRRLRAELDALEAAAVNVHPSRAVEFDRLCQLMRGFLTEAGLDPADVGHRKAFALGLCSGALWGEDRAKANAAAVLRPPVVTCPQCGSPDLRMFADTEGCQTCGHWWPR